MNSTTLTRCALAVALVSTATAGTAHAQQAFEDKYVPARTGTGELVPLPTVAIVPVGSVALHADVAAQLSQAVQNELESTTDTRFEIVTRPSGAAIGWAFVVRNTQRTQHDALTAAFTDQLITCLHALPEDDTEVAAINALLTAGSVQDQEQRDLATEAGRQMLNYWKADRCQTARNDLPFFERNRAKLTAASRGMLTDVFDPLVYNGQGLLDVIRALYGLYYHPGGFWTVEMVPDLNAVFEAGVSSGLFTTAETDTIGDREQQTFWDWVILAIATKSTIVRSFIESTADGCVRTVADLSKPFKLARCVADGKITLVPLRVQGRNYNTVQRVAR